jgi:hypothetical protein
MRFRAKCITWASSGVSAADAVQKDRGLTAAL